MTRAVTILLPSSGNSGAPPHRWGRVCRFVLRLDEPAAARLWSALPVKLRFVSLDDAERDRFVRELSEAGVAAQVITTEEGPRAGGIEEPPCAAHRRIAATEVCKKCGERRACALCLHAEANAECARCSGKTRFFTRFRRARIAVLLTILVTLVASTLYTTRRIASWQKPLTVGIYPIDAEDSAEVHAYTRSLTDSDFTKVSAFLEKEAKRYVVASSPLVLVNVARPFDELPPAPPDEKAGVVDIAKWSLRLRYWRWRVKQKNKLSSADVEIYVLYHAGKDERVLDRSVADQKVRVGIVDATIGRDDAGWTQLAVTHELLHTVGADDRYADDGSPRYPDGYAEPAKAPRYPQRLCEIMAGQIPTGQITFREPSGLDECLVGPQTAREIGWVKGP